MTYFHNHFYGDRNKTDNERYLEDRIRELEEQQERERQDREQAREERRQAIREANETWNRTASNWPECLQKQAYLMDREAHWDDDPDFKDDWFAPGADACRRALEIWHEVEPTKTEQIRQLEAAIQALRDSIRIEVAGKLEAESDSLSWKQVANALREYDDVSCEMWLNW